jgi:hypothetical protein
MIRALERPLSGLLGDTGERPSWVGCRQDRVEFPRIPGCLHINVVVTPLKRETIETSKGKDRQDGFCCFLQIRVFLSVHYQFGIMKRAVAALGIILILPFAIGALLDVVSSPLVRHNASWLSFFVEYVYWKGMWVFLFLAMPIWIVAKMRNWIHWLTYVLSGLFLGLVEPIVELVKYRAPTWWLESMTDPVIVQQYIGEVLGWTAASLLFWTMAVRSSDRPGR